MRVPPHQLCRLLACQRKLLISARTKALLQPRVLAQLIGFPLGEDALPVLTALLLQDIHDEVVKRHTQVVAVLGIVAVNLRCTAVKVHLQPIQTCRQREQHHVALVLLKLR